MAKELIDFINEALPDIDNYLTEQNIPIYQRFYCAGRLFVEAYVTSPNFSSTDELLKSEVYFESILPLFNNWYFNKYGELSSNPSKNYYAGMVLLYGQPVELKIPSSVGEVVEVGKLAKMTFVDHLHHSEKIESLLVPNVDLKKMDEDSYTSLRSEIEKVVCFTRSINLDLNTFSNLDLDTSNMAKGVWSHFEDGINKIVGLKSELASIACWDFHLAIEKSIKVLTFSKCGKYKFIHSLSNLLEDLQSSGVMLDSSSLLDLPSDAEAIKLRYAQLIKSPNDAFNYYMDALKFVSQVASKLEHEFVFKNVSFIIKKAPWAR